MAMVGSVKRDLIVRFRSAYWQTLPVFLPITGLISALAYRAFRLRVIKESLVYTITGAVMLTSALYTRGEASQRVIGIFNAIVGLYYFSFGGLSYDEDDLNRPGFDRDSSAPWIS